MKASSNTFKSVVSYTRKVTARRLDARKLKGAELPADPAAGRHARCWAHGEAHDGRPIVVELHGGGFALGDARKGDALREWIAQRFGVSVVGVDYRLAPEHPYPAALDDVVSAIRYVSQCCSDDGVKSDVHLLGYSAGANLALSAAIALRDDPQVSIGGMALHYPMVDAGEMPVGDDDPAGLPHELMEAFSDAYAAGRDLSDPGISPGLAPDCQLRGLAPVTLYPVVGDPLYVQAERFYLRLNSLGCAASWHPVRGAYHGYIEDAADLELYREMTLPETAAARPADFVEVAARQLDASLAELVGQPVCDAPFPALLEGGPA